MREGIVKNDIYIKEVRIKFGKKEKIYIKYVEKGVDKTVEDEDRATDAFYNVLRKLKKAGNRMLDFPYPVDTRIVITGAKFKWKDYKLQEVKLIGNYVLNFSGVIEQKFFLKVIQKLRSRMDLLQRKWIYWKNCKCRQYYMCRE